MQQSPAPGNTATPPSPQGPAPPGATGFAAQLFAPEQTSLLGDLFGVRAVLGNYGVSTGLLETSEVFGNASGGLRRGASYDGLTLISLGVDTQKAFGWHGGTFNVSAFQIHGRNLGAENQLDLQTASGIEASRSTRLWELWYQQTLLGGKIDVKVGQQSLDEEFMTSSYAGAFINTALGWPVIPTYDQYGGGPAYPLSALGVRMRARPIPSLTVLAGVFNDNPPGGPFRDDSQLRGAEQSGTRFNLDTGALFIAEIQYAVNQSKDTAAASPQPHGGLPGTYKLGVWFDTAPFADQRYDAAGLTLADPRSSGVPRMRRHDFSVYGIADQMVWQPDPQAPQSLGVFVRLIGAPGDRNLIELGLNAGVVLKAPLPGRDGDSFGVAYGLAKVSSRASQLDRDVASIRAAYPVRSSESFVEATYQVQVAPWWLVQPDIQYVFLPSGGIANPDRPGKRIGNEAVFGVRTNVTF